MRRGASELQSWSFIQETEGRTGWGRGEGERRLGRLSWPRAYPETPTLELHTPSDLQVYPRNIRAQKDFRDKPSRQDFGKDWTLRPR